MIKKRIIYKRDGDIGWVFMMDPEDAGFVRVFHGMIR